jgi:preprotein translocase subunit SecD
VLRAAAAGVAGLLLLTACTLSDDADEEPQPRQAVRLELYSSVPEPQRTRPEGEPTVAACRSRRTVCPGVSEPGGTYYYVFRQTPSLTNEDFDLAETRQDFDGSTGEPIVLLRLNREGETAFRALTRRLAQRSSPAVLAIVVDGEVVSAPTFDPSLFPEGHDPGSGIQLSGLGSLEEARALAQVLKLSADRASAAEMEH